MMGLSLQSRLVVIHLLSCVHVTSAFLVLPRGQDSAVRCLPSSPTYTTTQQEGNYFALQSTKTEDVLVEQKATAAAEENNPRLEGLAFMLDDGTRKSHSLAQNTAFVSGFFRGLSTKEAYRNLLTSLYFVYTEMEDSFDRCDSQHVRMMDDRELRRVDALSNDMDYFYGGEWKSVITPSPFTQKYVARIREVANGDKPYLLIAHQYTRYLGDLFGGQMMSGMATRSLDLGKGNGVAFYTFDEIKSAKDFITDWYARLNSLDFTNNQKQEIVDEANLVFDLNIGILEELEGSPLRALWTMAFYSLKEKLGLR